MLRNAVLRAIPVVLVIFVMFWGYYAFACQLYMYEINNSTKRATYTAIFNILFCLMAWSYFACTFTAIAKVPQPYKLPMFTIELLRNLTTEEALNETLVDYCRTNKIRLWTRTEFGYIRYCYRCKCIKPDRSHHCRVCDTCILKMDHHCPWMNTCINFSNYKMFMLFNFYCTIFCIFAVATSVPSVKAFFKEKNTRDYHNLHFVIACFAAAIFGILTLIISLYHIDLICQNQTTLEHLTTPVFVYREKLTYSIGCSFNWKEVFGGGYGVFWTWFVPTKIDVGNGVEFFTAYR